MYQCDHQINFSSICRSVTYILWPSKFASYLKDYLLQESCSWNDRSVTLETIACLISLSLTLKYFVIKKWRRPGVFVTLWALALVDHTISIKVEQKQTHTLKPKKQFS